MVIIDPGHIYKLHSIDGGPNQILNFVKREGPGYPGNIGSYSGTNIQEVLRVLIDRVKYLDNQIPCDENKAVLRFLRESLIALEWRASDRHDVPLLPSVELIPFCPKCGHWNCSHGEERR